MIDRTEQERLLLSYFIAQKYYKTKGSNAERHKEQCASRAQNGALDTTRESQRTGCAALRVRIEKKSTEDRDIDK